MASFFFAFMILAAVNPLPHSAGGRAALFVSSATATQTCMGPSRGYGVSVSVTNGGTAFSPPVLNVTAVTVRDSATPPRWTGHAGLPAMAPQSTSNVLIRLSQSAGTSAAPRLPLVVTLNAGSSIGGSRSASITTMSLSHCLTPKPQIAKSNPGVILPGVPFKPKGLIPPTSPPRLRPSPMPATFIAPPTNLKYTTDPQVCYNLVGFYGAFICPELVQKTGLLLLYWNWAPCTTSACVQHIQGYNIYPSPPGPLVDRQTDPTSMFRAISPYHQGECLVVTAYGYGHESDGSNTLCIGASSFLNTPWSLGGYVEGGQSSGDMFLSWLWGRCAAAGCVQNPDGYNVYLVGGKFVTSSRVTEAEVGQTQAGTCYVVRAFKGQIQSDPSSPFCVTQQMMPPPPTSAPMQVTIHVPGDTFPANTVVHVGGTVTWINDDTDDHNVDGNWGWDASIHGNGGVAGNGGSAQYTFNSVGVFPYHCDYHNGMQGVITVVAH